MAEFSVEKPVVVKAGDPIELPEIQLNPGSRYWIECEWIQDGKKENGHWEIGNDSMEGAYLLWRKEHWKTLFDPFNVKILRLNITKVR